MNIPKKGSRKINVGGKDYIYTVKGSPNYFKQTAPSLLITIQEDQKNPGDPMQAIVASKNWTKDCAMDEENVGSSHKNSFTPKHVKLLINESIKASWQPSSKSNKIFDLNTISINKIDLGEWFVSKWNPSWVVIPADTKAKTNI